MLELIKLTAREEIILDKFSYFYNKCYEIIENIYILALPHLQAQSSSNPCNFSSDKKTRSIFGSNICPLTHVMTVSS